MKKKFKQQLWDYLYTVISNNNWELDWACENELNLLFERSVEKVSHDDCSKDEMCQFAKTNLVHLLAYMWLDAKNRGRFYLDGESISNALSNFSVLWPFKETQGRWSRPSPLYMQHPEFSIINP